MKRRRAGDVPPKESAFPYKNHLCEKLFEDQPIRGIVTSWQDTHLWHVVSGIIECSGCRKLSLAALYRYLRSARRNSPHPSTAIRQRRCVGTEPG